MKKQIEGNDLYNAWLKYHNTNVDEIVKKHPKLSKTPKWFNKYAVTQEQHDEWVEWAKEHIRKITKYSKRYIDRHFWSVYLNYAPSIKTKKNEKR